MVSWKDEFKHAGIELGYDLLLVALVICWVAAVVTAILEITLWIVFGLFLLGCVFLFSMFYVSKKYDENEKEEQSEELKVEKQPSK